MGRRGILDMDVHAVLARKTDSRGIFRVPMPYTEDVVAYVLEPGFEKALVRARPDGRHHPVTGLEIVLHKAVRPRRMTLTDDAGRPIPGVNTSFRQIGPQARDQIQFPGLQTDAQGRLDVTWLETGCDCVLMPGRGARFAPQRFTCRPGGTIKLGKESR
jgi:hypothetical protein